MSEASENSGSLAAAAIDFRAFDFAFACPFCVKLLAAHQQCAQKTVVMNTQPQHAQHPMEFFTTTTISDSDSIAPAKVVDVHVRHTSPPIGGWMLLSSSSHFTSKKSSQNACTHHNIHTYTYYYNINTPILALFER